MKTCNKCFVEKDDGEFRKKKSTKDGLSNTCKDCQKEIDKKTHERLRESRVASMKTNYEKIKLKSHYKTKYGITVADYNSMFEKQGGCCAICGVHQDNTFKRFCVDHNHETGQVRGLLCHNCNSALGNFMDSVDNLNNAISYLKERGSYGKS
jgi:hypothetical protein